jgi:hypothetical protein
MKQLPGKKPAASAVILLTIVLSLTSISCGLGAPEPLKRMAGQTAAMGKTEVSVVGVMKAQTAGNAAAKDKFLIVDLTVKNKSDSKMTLKAASFGLSDPEGKVYNYNREASQHQAAVFPNANVKPLDGAVLGAKSDYRLVAVYEISSGASGLVLDIAGKGFGADRNARFDLGF